MKFCYDILAGSYELIIQGDLFNHLYRARRTRFLEFLYFRNLKDSMIYQYAQKEITKKQAILTLTNSWILEILPKKTHLIWAITEAKNIEKTLPYLNQLGVRKISLFYANRTQKNEKISLERLNRILIASCEQCGRSMLMEIEVLKNIQEVLKRYHQAKVLNFGGENIYEQTSSFENGIIIGPEGGFDDEEQKIFSGRQVVCVPNGIVLKSECAAMLIAGLATI